MLLVNCSFTHCQATVITLISLSANFLEAGPWCPCDYYAILDFKHRTSYNISFICNSFMCIGITYVVNLIVNQLSSYNCVDWQQCSGCPHVSGDFCIRKFFYADTPSVHTCPPYAAQCIRRLLYTLSTVEISVHAVYPDTCGRSYPYIFVYADVTVSEPVFFFVMHMLCWLILWDVRIRTNRIRVDGRIRFVYATCGRRYFCIRIKNLRIQKSPDTCGRGLTEWRLFWSFGYYITRVSKR